MATEKLLRDARAFADAYKPSEEDHPDLESRVVMYRRAVEAGDKRVEVVHARTLMQFVGHLGLEVESSTAAGDGPSRAELQDRARELGLSVSGSKAALASRIAEAEAAAGDDPDDDPDDDTGGEDDDEDES